MTFGTRQRKCIIKSCRQPFKPISMTHKCCSAPCAAEYAKEVRVKKEAQEARLKSRREAEEKREHRKKAEKLKSRSEWMKEAQAAFNAWVRWRDKDKSCISCDRPAGWDGQWHASHFKSVGANSALRFNLWNVHKSCSICNHMLSGNIGEYSFRLPLRIGKERYEWIQQADRVRKFDIDYLKRIRDIFRKRLRLAQRRL